MAEQKNSNTDETIIESQSITGGHQDGDNKKSKFPGFNLYVKNLDDSFNDASLKEVFDEFGTITSVKVMCDFSGHSKGFGFVCFAVQEEANKALTKMNGRIVGTKPLYVAMAQKKEERKQYLSDRYKNLSMNSSAPLASPPPVPQPGPAVVPQAVEPPTQFSYIPNNSVMHAGPSPYRFVASNLQWPATGQSQYIMPPGPVSRAVTYSPYQPLYLVPSVNMMAPPQQMPILHQPIYIHSSKTNTLIYSTGVQAAPPQVPSPSSYLTTHSSGGEFGGTVVHSVQQGSASPQVNTHFKDISKNAQTPNQQPIAYNNVDLSQAHTQHDANNIAVEQVPSNTNYNIPMNNGFTT